MTGPENLPHKEQPSTVQLIGESEYVSRSVEYALSIGWVRKEKESILINGYLIPLYQQTRKILEEVQENGLGGVEFDRIIKKLNACLEATRRIGSADSNNILLSIKDLQRSIQTPEEEYALESFYDFTASLLNWRCKSAV